jgi:ribosome-binding factor A
MMSNIFKGTQFSSFVFELTLNGHNSLIPHYIKTMREAQLVKHRVKQQIEFMPALLLHNGNAAIFPNTISVIQGQSGVHKSGIAQLICASLIKHPANINFLLGFEVQEEVKDIHVLYIDTERNLADQFPFAMQKIITQAGYSISDNLTNFHFISFLSAPRKERPELLNLFLKDYTQRLNGHLVVVLDVSTDFIEDFNSVNDTMKLSDVMNNMINQHKVTFLCVIHENPGSEKARGHYGTEMSNKATTVIQVAENKHLKSSSPIYQLKYLKNRNTKRLPSIHFEYDESERCLVTVKEEVIKDLQELNIIKATKEEVTKVFESFFEMDECIMRTALLKLLESELDISERTAIDRLSDFYKDEFPISKGGLTYKLCKRKVKQGDQYYLTLK